MNMLVRGFQWNCRCELFTISNIELVAYGFPYFTIRVTCSSGTYIRSLLRDICIRLGIPGTMTSLARTAVGPFDIQSSYIAEELTLHGEKNCVPHRSCGIASFKSGRR